MLKVVGEQRRRPLIAIDEALRDHRSLIDGYINSHKARGLAKTTIEKEEAFLNAWFETHGPKGRPLFIWEAMDEYNGRKHIIDYRDVLVEAELQTETIRAYLGILKRLFDHVLSQPVLFTTNPYVLISERYGVMLTQTVSQFDMPRYIWDGERKGIPLDPEKLYDFLKVMRDECVGKDPDSFTMQRNYALCVLASECGFRIDELLHLEIENDLFFESSKVQTRHAKGAKGSGKRTRVSLFTPLAKDTIRYYLKIRRRRFNVNDTGYLFLSKLGRPLTYNAVQPQLKEMVCMIRRLDFPVMEHLTWHWFRRIFATRFIERFPNRLPVLIELLGHMSPNTVHRYIRHSKAWMDDQIQEALKGGERWPSTGS